MDYKGSLPSAISITCSTWALSSCAPSHSTTHTGELKPSFLAQYFLSLRSVKQDHSLSLARYATRPRMSVLGIYDPTAVMNGDEMDRNKKEGFVKLALYLINFFAGLLW